LLTVDEVNDFSDVNENKVKPNKNRYL